MAGIQIAVSLGREGLFEKLTRFEGIVSRVSAVSENVAMESLVRLVNSTPIRYTGNTRKGWVHRKLGSMNHLLVNPNKVMGFLEYGTKAHGPVRARALFIPLNVQAFHAGPKGVMAANAQARANNQWRNYGNAVRGRANRRARLPFQIGVDFLFVKRVKGIRAHHIARDEQARVTRILVEEVKNQLRRELQ